MKDIFISFVIFFTISFTIYFNYTNSDIEPIHLSNSSTTSKFNSGISIKDAGEIVIIEQKPNNATVIIDKDDLEDIIVFLNDTNESE